MRHFKLIFVVLAGVAAFSTAGCQLMPHALQPSQLQKMNRQPARDVQYNTQGQPEFTLADTTEPVAVELVAS